MSIFTLPKMFAKRLENSKETSGKGNLPKIKLEKKKHPHLIKLEV